MQSSTYHDIMTQQVPRLTAFLRANGGGSGALDAAALYLQRKQAMQARFSTKQPEQVSIYPFSAA